MVGCGGAVLDAWELAEADRELRLKLWAPVMDHLLGHSVQPKDVDHEQPGCLLGIEQGGSGDGMKLLGEPINDHQNRVLSLGLRQGTDEVHGNGGPGSRRGVMGVKGAAALCLEDLLLWQASHPLTHLTSCWASGGSLTSIPASCSVWGGQLRDGHGEP